MQAVDINGNYHEVSLDEISWRPSAYGIVIRDGKVLVSPQHGIGYDLPGGGVDLGESFETAVVREVKEETGIDVKVKQFAMAADNIFVWKPDEPEKRGVYHSILCYYLCEYVGGELSMDGFDDGEKEYAELARWMPIEEASTMPIASSYDFRPIIASMR